MTSPAMNSISQQISALEQHLAQPSYSMSLSKADTLLAQWAVWSFDDTRTGFAIGSWQKDYRTIDWDEGDQGVYDPSDKGRIGAGEESEMLRVDDTLSRLGGRDATSSHVLRVRYRFGYRFSPIQETYALQQFIAVWVDTPAIKN
jgi:hypothetical protein